MFGGDDFPPAPFPVDQKSMGVGAENRDRSQYSQAPMAPEVGAFGDEPPPQRRRRSEGSQAQSSSGRVPPHNIEAERSVLGAILLNGASLFQVQEMGLESRDFYLDAHQKVFDVLTELSRQGAPTDLVSLTAGLKDRSWHEAVGGVSYLSELLEDSFALSSVGHYGRIIREKAVLRRMIEVCSTIAAGAYEGVENVENFLDDAETQVFGVSDSSSQKSFASMNEILLANMHTIEELATRKEPVTGLPTGFHDYDKLTSGLHPGQLIIVGGRPAMGKTSLVLSAAQNAAVGKANAVVAIFSLEMTKEELGFRMLSSLSRVDSKRLKIGQLTDKEWPSLVKASDQLQRARIWIDDSGGLTVMNMRAKCRRLLAQHKKLDLIVVDYLQLMSGTTASKKAGSREQEISEISRGLKQLAKELKVPIIALSQLSRGLENRQDKRPMMSDLRESGAIEQDADMVCFVYRDEVYNKETEDKGVAELIVAKHRGGETATIRLAWLGQYTLFANLAPDAAGSPVPPPRPDRGDVGF